MINYNDYFQYINYNVAELINEILEYVTYSEKHNKFFIGQMGQCRIDFPLSIYQQFRQIMPFRISDYGCFKNSPGWIYPTHKDSKRKFAMNMLLSEINPKFQALFHNDELTESWPIPYIQNQWVLLNTKKFHSVKNNSDINRYVISVGCTSTDYNIIREVFNTNNSIGLLSDNKSNIKI